jgi:hypothetical protein
MIEQNLNGKLDIESLRKIRDILILFEREHDRDTIGKGRRLIKPSYIRDRIKL